MQADVTSHMMHLGRELQQAHTVAGALATALTVSSDILGSILPLHVLQKLEAKAAEVRKAQYMAGTVSARQPSGKVLCMPPLHVLQKRMICANAVDVPALPLPLSSSSFTCRTCKLT
jgi:hypothetical protein